MIRFLFVHSISLILVLNTVSCIGFKKNASNSSSVYYETFFINDSTLQYFIKPVTFKNKEKVIVDFTFRKSKESFSNIVMNFSFFSKNKWNIDHIHLWSENGVVEIGEMKVLFKEKKNKEFVYRFSTMVNYEDLKEFFISENHRFIVNETYFYPVKSSNKKIKYLKDDLFEFVLAK